MYDARAETYEDSWHPDYSRRFVALADIQPGDRVLSLCCGTGLDAFLAAEKVGPSGEVVGVDISEGMLAIAKRKQEADSSLGQRLRFFLHDVTDLDSLAEQEGGTSGAAAVNKGSFEVAKASFDWILCSNAYVLFRAPAAVARSWKAYLKPGTGKLVVDITHEHNLRSGMVLELAARRLGVSFPSHRAWVTSVDSFRDILKQEGYVVEQVKLLDKVTGQRVTSYSVNDADAQFDYIANTALTISHASDGWKEKLRPAFRDEWRAQAVDGRVEVVDALYVYVARKVR